MAAFKDVTGSVYGRLTAVKCLQKQGRCSDGRVQRTLWLCLCQCGVFTTAGACNLSRGDKKSCGCLAAERFYGKDKDYLHSTWAGIKTRCTNRNAINFKDYGAVGVSMHQAWAKDYMEFRRYILATIGARPTVDHTLDRINTAGSYEPGNVRWATRTEQNNNSKRNLMITYEGVHATLATWCAQLNLNYHRVYERLYKLGWSVDRAFSSSKSA